MIDFLLLAVVAVVTWCVAGDGVWGAAITFLSVLLGGLLAMQLFEPVASFLGNNFLTGYYWQMRVDIIALLGIFGGAVWGLRALGEKLLPTYAETHPLMHDVGRWVLSASTGYVVMAVLLTALHTAPLPREFLGFAPERRNLFDVVAPDRQWLGFTQYVSETSLRRKVNGEIVGFDSAEFPGNPRNPDTVRKWSTFILRYAARRDQFGQGGVTETPAAPPPASSSPSAPVPAGPGGGTGGF